MPVPAFRGAAPILFDVGSLSTASDRLILESRHWAENAKVELRFPPHIAVYPDGAVPFAATLGFLRNRGHRFSTLNASAYASRVGLFNAASPSEARFKRNPNNVVVRYSTEREAQEISTSLIATLTENVICQAGVIDALNWCVYEVLDNVFQHSGAADGHVMMQLHAKKRLFVIAAADTGKGIHRSMVEAADKSRLDMTQLRHAHLAIGHAMQQGVTSKAHSNQGNGLHGLRRSVEINGGKLVVRSGRGRWEYADGRVTADTDLARPVLDPDTAHSTTVDWRLDCATAVSINDALGRSERPSELLDGIEVAPDHYLIPAEEIEEFVGSRGKGLEIRTRLLNYLNAGARQIVIDLANVGVISSSFADEVAGKLAVELGELAFRRRVFFDGASVTNRDLIERAIELRLQQARDLDTG